MDVFFVLSRFLITGLLLDAQGDSHYFRFFYARRALRILPLYLLLVFGYLFLRGTQDYKHWAWLTFTFNIDMAIHGSNKMVIMNHLWSIALGCLTMILLRELVCIARFACSRPASLLAAIIMRLTIGDSPPGRCNGWESIRTAFT